MPAEHVDFVVRFADGYVRLSKLAADAVARDPGIDVRGLLDRDEIRGFLNGMLGHGDRRPLHVVAVLNSIGWVDDKQVEGLAVSKHFGLDWNDVRSSVDEYHRRFGIVPRGGRFSYISPIPLGIHLAVEAWSTFPDLLSSLPSALPTEGAKDAYYERLQAIASNPQAKSFAREELAHFFRLIDFIDVRSARRWSALSAADPIQAVRNLLTALRQSSPEERLKIEDGSRREIVWTLVRLAWRRETFFDATKALALLAEAENESWSNNSTSEFIGKFQVFLGGTSVPYVERLLVLDDLVAENRVVINRLAINALARIGDRQAFRTNSDPLTGELPEIEWRPSTGSEHFQCILAALQRLTSLTELADYALKDSLFAAADNLAMFLRDRLVRPIIERYFEAVLRAYPDAREELREIVSQIIVHERKYWKDLSPEELEELYAIHARFEDSSLKGRIRQYVGTPSWDRDEEPDLLPLAKDLLESRGVLQEEWPWLTSGNAGEAWRLGEALAQIDNEKVLASELQLIPDTGRDNRLLCGYIRECRHQLGDDWYNAWFDTLISTGKQTNNLIFEIARNCGFTPAVSHHISAIIRTGNVLPETVGQLAYSRLCDELDRVHLFEVLKAMVDYGHKPTALIILVEIIKSGERDLALWNQMALDIITTPGLINKDQTSGYYWKILALKYAKDYTTEIAAAIMKEQSDGSAAGRFLRYSELLEVLHACAKINPEAVWYALLPYLSSRMKAYRFAIGFPRGVIELIPQKQVLAWIAEQPDERAAIVAKLAEKDLTDDNNISSKILGAYGDRAEIASAFYSEYVTGSWSGPSSVHWEKLAESLNEVARHTKLPKLRKWADDASHGISRMAEQERQNEEEEELRRI
jgi:hypothetical protein